MTPPRDRLPPPRPRRDRPGGPGGKDPGASTGVAAPDRAEGPKPRVDPLIGRTIGRCVLEARIGAGRTSVVYRARHTGLDATVAVKILLPESVAQPSFVEKFENEARAIARLDHENILKIYDVLREGELHGIVMELLEGETVLEHLEREGRVAPMDALRIVKQAALGLAAAHAKQILHRDVKPQNLVVLPDGLVKVVDFGLAEEGGSTEASRIGTPHYMAPEIWEGRPPETRSDVYALGITLHHLLVGQPPYAGRNLKGIMAGHVEGTPLYPERAVPSLPKALCELVRDMTKRDSIARLDLAHVVERIDGIGGEEIRSPAGVRLRGGRRRAREAKGPSPALIAVGALLVAGVAVAILSAGGGGDPGPARRDPSPSASIPLPPIPEPVASSAPDPGAARREEDAATRAAEAAKAAEGDRALKAVEAFARESWTDVKGVMRRYRSVGERFPGTPAATEARKRADEIGRGLRHPHPDRAIVSKATLEAALAAWAEARPRYEEAIAQRRYADALALVPAGVDSALGEGAAELAFHRELAKRLVDFLAAVRSGVAGLPERERRMALDGADVPVVALDDTAVYVAGDGGSRRVALADLPPEALLDLGRRALRGGTGRESVLLVAFAFAHRLTDPFYSVLLAARVAKPAQAEAAALDAYEARADARFAPR